MSCTLCVKCIVPFDFRRGAPTPSTIFFEFNSSMLPFCPSKTRRYFQIQHVKEHDFKVCRQLFHTRRDQVALPSFFGDNNGPSHFIFSNSIFRTSFRRQLHRDMGTRAAVFKRVRQCGPALPLPAPAPAACNSNSDPDLQFAREM